MDHPRTESEAADSHAAHARIVAAAGRCGGKPHIAGHRIKVQHVAVWHERMARSPEEIVAEHPELTLADVYAALSYYHEHREEIDADLRDDEEFVADLRAKSPPSLLRGRLG